MDVCCFLLASSFQLCIDDSNCPALLPTSKWIVHETWFLYWYNIWIDHSMIHIHHTPIRDFNTCSSLSEIAELQLYPSLSLIYLKSHQIRTKSSTKKNINFIQHTALVKLFVELQVNRKRLYGNRCENHQLFDSRNYTTWTCRWYERPGTQLTVSVWSLTEKWNDVVRSGDFCFTFFWQMDLDLILDCCCYYVILCFVWFRLGDSLDRQGNKNENTSGRAIFYVPHKLDHCEAWGAICS